MGNHEFSSQSDASHVYALIERIFPGASEHFTVKIHQNSSTNFFEISQFESKILILGSDNVSISYGFNYYLRFFLNSSVSWCGDNVQKALKFPLPSQPIRKTCSFKHRYYLNYCTHSYSMAFWDWPRWEREIDWMALHGVNLVLAVTGQQAVWRNTMRKMKFSEEEIRKFIPGPAFEAWWLMQNLEGWGGPVSDEFIDERSQLQSKIIKRMRELDIEPVLQSFYGMVPRATLKYANEARFIDSGKWQGFERPLFLDPLDPLFDEFSSVFYEEQFKLYGECFFFAGDPFHELAVGKGDFKNLKSLDLRVCGSKIYNAMKKFCDKNNSKKKKVTWILQAWEGGTQPNSDLLKGLVKGEVLVLDIFSDGLPQWGGVEGVWSREKRSYEGHDWVWCVLDNFGGVHGIFGRIQKIIEELPKALKHPLGKEKLKGIGATMEGIERNCIVFDLLFDIAWNIENFKIEEWMKMFVKSRYGKENEKIAEAWNILRKHFLSEESDEKMSCFNIVSMQPKLIQYPISNSERTSLKNLLDAWKYFIEIRKEFSFSETFQYDILDLTRQILIDYMYFLYLTIVKCVKMKNLEEFSINSQNFIECLDILDDLLGTNKEFLLGKWIADASALGTNPDEKKLLVWNAKQQITCWGFNRILVDYAKKDWNGLVKGFYKGRWIFFFEELKSKWVNLSFGSFDLDYAEIDKTWVKSENSFNYQPLGDLIEKCNEVYNKIYDKTVIYTQNVNE